MKVNEFDLAVEIFHQSRAAFNPIPAVQIFDAVDGLDLGAMDVAADDTLGILFARHGSQRVFVFRHVLHRGLGLHLHVGRQRPVTEAERAAQAVEVQVEIQDPVVQVRTEFLEQVVEMREAVRLVAVDDEVFFAVRADVHHFTGHGHAAETHADELFHEFIVIAGDVDDLGLLAAFAEELLDERVIIITPVPAEAQFPAIDEVADEVKVFAIDHLEEVEQLVDAAVTGTEMDVGNPHRTANYPVFRVQVQIKVTLLVRHKTQ